MYYFINNIIVISNNALRRFPMLYVCKTETNEDMTSS